MTTSGHSGDPAPSTLRSDEFLADGGEMGRLMRAHDWTTSRVGPPDTWPQALRTTVRLLLNSSHPMYIFWGREGYCFYNDAYKQSIGPERHPSSLGKPAFEVWEEIWPIIGPQIEQVMSGGGPTWNVNHLVPITRHGVHQEVYWTYSYSPIDDPESPLGIGGVLVVCTETTETVMANRRQEFRIELEETLRSTRDPEELLAAVATLLGQHLNVEQCGYGEFDDSGEYITVKPGWFRGTKTDLSGRHRFDKFGEQIAGDLRKGRVVQLVDSLADERTRGCAEAFAAIGNIRAGINVPIRLDGRTIASFFVHETAPRDWSKDEVDLVCMVGEQFWIALDHARALVALARLTARLEQEVEERTAELQASQSRQRTIFETSYQYQGLLALDGTLLDANATSLAGIDAKLEDVVGLPFWETPWFTESPGMPEVVRKGVEVVARGGTLRQEICLNLLGTKHWFAFAMRPMRDENGEITGIIPEALETTRRHEAEAQLRQAQKMEALGNLTGGVAHDFNNLLQVVSGNLQLIAKDVADNEKIEARLRNAIFGVQRGSRLVSQLLAFGRRQELAPEPINPGAFLHAMEDMLRQVVGEELELEIIVSDGQWNTKIDRAQAENALLNLAVNARDAMDRHGRLVISTANTVMSADDVAGRADLAAGEYVVITVSDNGPGMPEEAIKQAFDPFFTTKPVGEGTGLGLSMVWGLVKQSNGHVEIQSSPGQGTSVHMYLPRCLEEPSPAHQHQETAAAGGSETVLVVEDDEDVRKIIIGMLSELGYNILEAYNPQHALEILEGAPDIDLVLSDVIMPGPMLSTEMAAEIRRRKPDISVLFVSGYTRDVLDKRNRIEQDIELLEKPFTQESLGTRIRELLARKATPTETTTVRTVGDDTPRRVLVVEDDHMIRMMTAEMISDLGYRPLEASGVAEALAILKDQEIHVLLTDLGLPDGSGHDLAVEASKYMPHSRIIFATGQETSPAPEESAELKSAYHLKKPFDDRELAAALAMVCQ